MTMARSTLLSCILFLSTYFSSAQAALKQQILGSVIYTTYGDRTPFVLPQAPVLTPLGAQQLFNAGFAFRERYLVSSNNGSEYGTAIDGIAPNVLDNDQITILTTDDQFVVASALAFMQGLYPPLEDLPAVDLGTVGSQLANGTNVLAPLGGFQYPNIYTAGPLDVDSIWVAGMNNCPQYTASVSQYFSSPEYQTIQQQTEAFYASLEPTLLSGIFPNSSVGYFDAYDIWDYINYAVTHNSTVAGSINNADFTRASILADDLVFAQNANLSASGLTQGDMIRAIAGQTLATRIIEALYMNINTGGQYSKMTLLFGSFEPLISFLALASLPSSQNEQFYGIPQPGSSMVIELFSLSNDDNGTYPDSSNLYVQFLYQNGTGHESILVAYPLFGLSPSQIVMSLDDFIASMSNIMIPSIADWCSTCSSYSVFCPAFEQNNGPLTCNEAASTTSGMSPVVAGVIGALVTLVVAGLIFGATMLFGGLRLSRRRRSELGGFKGARKLASDQDLTLPKAAAGATGSEAGTSEPKGHERVGSWELGASGQAQAQQRSIDQAKDLSMRRPSFEDDDIHVSPYVDPTKPHESV